MKKPAVEEPQMTAPINWPDNSATNAASKFRRQGTKLVSALKALTGSGKHL
jgi:hypothetical protein